MSAPPADPSALPPAAPHAAPLASLAILPGTLLVGFLVRLGSEAAAWFTEPARFLEGLKAACDLLGFAELHRDEDRIDELLPWAGNV